MTELRLPRCQALILDMDGLLLDTEAIYASAWRRAAAAQGHHFDDAFCASLAGLHYQGVEARIAANYQGVDFERFRRQSGQYWRELVYAQGIPLRPGFHALFAALATSELPYCLATNSRSSNAEECLGLAGVAELLPMRLTRDHVSEGKPAPEIFLKAAQLLAVDVRHCWAVEDSYPGVLAAKTAGAFTLCIPQADHCDPRATEMADFVLQSLAELGEIILAQQANDDFETNV